MGHVSRHMVLVQTHNIDPHIFQIKLCKLNSSICAAWSEIWFEVHHVFISQKLKKLKEEESLPIGPSCAAACLSQWYLLLHAEYSSWSYYHITFAKVHPVCFIFFHTYLHLWICVPKIFCTSIFSTLHLCGQVQIILANTKITSDFWHLLFDQCPNDPQNDFGPTERQSR